MSSERGFAWEPEAVNARLERKGSLGLRGGNGIAIETRSLDLVIILGVHLGEGQTNEETRGERLVLQHSIVSVVLFTVSESLGFCWCM